MLYPIIMYQPISWEWANYIVSGEVQECQIMLIWKKTRNDISFVHVLVAIFNISVCSWNLGNHFVFSVSTCTPLHEMYGCWSLENYRPIALLCYFKFYSVNICTLWKYICLCRCLLSMKFVFFLILDILDYFEIRIESNMNSYANENWIDWWTLGVIKIHSYNSFVVETVFRHFCNIRALGCEKFRKENVSFFFLF